MKHYSQFRSFGDFLKHLRLTNDLSQDEVGKVVMPGKQFSNRSISRIEAGKQNVRDGEFALFAQALKCEETILKTAFSFFKGEQELSEDDPYGKDDLRPLLKDLVGADKPITRSMLEMAITHWLALKQIIAT